MQLAGENSRFAGAGVPVVLVGYADRGVGTGEIGSVHVHLYPTARTDGEASGANAFFALDEPQLVIAVVLARGQTPRFESYLRVIPGVLDADLTASVGGAVRRAECRLGEGPATGEAGNEDRP